MSAVMEERRPRGRPKLSYEQNVVNSELKYWGYHKGKQYAADGWSPMNTLAQLLSGRSDRRGHRVLVLEMPAEAWRINAYVMRLPTDYISALVSRYCLPVEPSTGRPYDAAYLAGLLSVDLPTYRERLNKAKIAYGQLIFRAAEVHSFS